MIKHKYLVLLWKAVVIAAVVLTPANALAQEQNAQPQSDSGEKVNTFAIDAELMTRSELRMGGLPDNEEDHDNMAGVGGCYVLLVFLQRIVAKV